MTAVFVPLSAMFADRSLYDMVLQAHNQVEWLIKCHEYIVLDDASQLSASDWQYVYKSFTDYFTKAFDISHLTGEEKAWAEQAISSFRASPLVARIMNMGSLWMAADGEAATELLVNEFKAWAGGDVGERCQLDSFGASVLTRLVGDDDEVTMISEDAFRVAISFGQRVGDRALVLQVSYIQQLYNVVVSFAKATALARACFEEGAPLSRRKLTDATVSFVKESRDSRAAYENCCKATPDPFSVEGRKFHLRALHGLVDVAAVTADLDTEATTLFQTFGNEWAHDISTVAETLESTCSDWRLYKVSLLSEAGQPFLQRPRQ
jgi:hypothetical protein